MCLVQYGHGQTALRNLPVSACAALWPTASPTRPLRASQPASLSRRHVCFLLCRLALSCLCPLSATPHSAPRLSPGRAEAANSGSGNPIRIPANQSRPAPPTGVHLGRH
ncbi:uncharacterized protein B0I36DRAFT_6881 [Microdochium trichocladiopsis]|uniref:Uncharacterized protein n=1 Tax=Microdochium trichocladiopsis TaxID=1682393 RepID=A0A9P9BZJ7_9PEZI|nr:uncharacterized protein B0I36DRAFT_6881 [Microdochium trichocladiopsis]KAH7040184.1 hypothetical protein B0I36DRAFT_6881 [Microdochium trichocladiopsis]